jgi:hypothetical protein
MDITVIWWTEDQIETLKQLYPTKDKKEILKALKPKTWYAITKQAKELKLVRTVKILGRPKKKPRQVLGKNELTELLRKDLTIDQIAKKLRTEPHIVRRFIQKYGI